MEGFIIMISDQFGSHQHVSFVARVINEKFPYFSGTLTRQYETFGLPWLDAFNSELEVFFGKELDRLKSAVLGYGKFALDAMKLQVKFQKTKEYEAKTYEEAAALVYQDPDYMFNMYLPGILLSHYLWRHHYQQKLFFKEEFVPLALERKSKSFYDVGVGTGFYSRELLANLPVTGIGLDLSASALSHAKSFVDASNYGDRYQTNITDIVNNTPKDKCDIICSIEVLEHLEDPLTFLKSLFSMTAKNGLGFISAAMNAPNADHIYLFKHWSEVADLVTAAGFDITAKTVDTAYDPRGKGEIVPENVAFIVSK